MSEASEEQNASYVIDAEESKIVDEGKGMYDWWTRCIMTVS